MRYLGLVIEEALHTWFENTRLFNSPELLDHLVDKVFPHEKTNLPTEAPITAPTLATFQNLGKI